MELTTLRTSKAPKDIEELTERIEAFFSTWTVADLMKKPISPRLFRISIGVSKQTLSNGKTNKNRKGMFDLIKTHEDILLAFIEQKTLDTDAKQVLGLFNTLRAYDTERYAIEFRQTNKVIEAEPIIIKGLDTSSKKLPKSIAKALTIETPATVEAEVKET